MQIEVVNHQKQSIPQYQLFPAFGLLLEQSDQQDPSANVVLEKGASQIENSRIYQFQIAPKNSPKKIHTISGRSNTKFTLNSVVFGRRSRPDFFHADLLTEYDGYYCEDLAGVTEDQYGNSVHAFIEALREVVAIPGYESALGNDTTLTVIQWLTHPTLRVGVSNKSIGGVWFDKHPVLKIGVNVGKDDVGSFVYPE